MSTYLYELPTTGAISFADFCADQSTGKSYISHLSQTTQTRANLRGALKESKRSDDSEKDYLKLVKILDEYLPMLRGVMVCVAHGEIGLKTEPVFSWRTTLSANLFNSSPRLSLPTLHADRASTLLTYAFALSNLARSNVASLGSYESERGISDIERKAKDEKLNFAVTLLCRASGIFTYIGETVLTEWDKATPAGIVQRPPDLTSEVNSGLAKVALADAQSLAIRKLLSKSTYDSTITPGPPLPRSHPSPALIAKLHLECAALYSSARSLVKTFGSKGGDASEVSADLRRYLADEASFHNALSRKWLGVDAGENGGNEKGGVAVGFLAWAKKEIEELKDRGKAIAIGKDKEVKERRRAKVLEELRSINVFLTHYKKLNDSLTFQPVPSPTDLQATIPAGRQAVAVKPYSEPLPAFGPGSTEHTRRQMEDLGTGHEEEGSSSALHTGSFGDYAGAGSYF